MVTALLFAGRAEPRSTSEIGLMRATDQLTAMEMMAVDPMRYVAAPRFIGGIIAMPLLVAIFDIVGRFRCAARRRADDECERRDVLVADAGRRAPRRRDREGIIKSLAFGFVCTLIAVYEGYNAAPTAEGVGLATTRTVVASRRADPDRRLLPDRCFSVKRNFHALNS